MTERITPSMVTGTMIGDLSTSLAGLERTTEELSSGKSILEPSEDPYGASQVIAMQSQLDGLTEYENSAQNGISWLSTASDAMTSIGSAVQRVRELVVQAANGTNSKSDRETDALEIEQLTETIKQDANTQFAGQYIFSGTATSTAPYEPGENDEYKGNTESIQRMVGPGASVSVSINLSKLLGDGASSEDGKLLDTLNTIAKQMRESSAESVAALGDEDLGKLDTHIEELSDLQAAAGSATDQMKAAVARNEDVQASIQKGLSSVDETNIATVSIAYSNEQAAYQAALRASATIIQESLLNFLQ
jgi:flagellar hook-associated protein 3 FlgL